MPIFNWFHPVVSRRSAALASATEVCESRLLLSASSGHAHQVSQAGSPANFNGTWQTNNPDVKYGLVQEGSTVQAKLLLTLHQGEQVAPNPPTDVAHVKGDKLILKFHYTRILPDQPHDPVRWKSILTQTDPNHFSAKWIIKEQHATEIFPNVTGTKL